MYIISIVGTSLCDVAAVLKNHAIVIDTSQNDVNGAEASGLRAPDMAFIISIVGTSLRDVAAVC